MQRRTPLEEGAHNQLPFLFSAFSVTNLKSPSLHQGYEKKSSKLIKGHAIAVIWGRARSSVLEHNPFLLHSCETSASVAHGVGQTLKKCCTLLVLLAKMSRQLGVKSVNDSDIVNIFLEKIGRVFSVEILPMVFLSNLIEYCYDESSTCWIIDSLPSL